MGPGLLQWGQEMCSVASLCAVFPSEYCKAFLPGPSADLNRLFTWLLGEPIPPTRLHNSSWIPNSAGLLHHSGLMKTYGGSPVSVALLWGSPLCCCVFSSPWAICLWHHAKGKEVDILLRKEVPIAPLKHSFKQLSFRSSVFFQKRCGFNKPWFRQSLKLWCVNRVSDMLQAGWDQIFVQSRSLLGDFELVALEVKLYWYNKMRRILSNHTQIPGLILIYWFNILPLFLKT